MKKRIIVLALALLLAGCQEANYVGLRPPAGKNAERFGTDRAGTVNFHLVRLSVALDAEHKKAVELAGRIRELERKAIVDGDRIDLSGEFSYSDGRVIEQTYYSNKVITKADPNE